ncbi:hypothetical protein [Rhodanobacter sp. DHB23]|uniref:hypothetical protein n=1 Tax=Rhodanobacter sp. DHB23 TaxID=2775923 RepID=UPI001783E258|nr:hypothetical protein [Rhodanobacter sp. DHB23]MBD8872529.1 hypothetical protein [Rhodanobacter sp. DHB23]
MVRPVLHHLRRCRALFALALCAWLGLATAVFAKADCCAGMAGMPAMKTMTHHHDAPAPMHADGMHADCACAHMTATLPLPVVTAGAVRFAMLAWQAQPAVAPDLAHAPPLRPPLA